MRSSSNKIQKIISVKEKLFSKKEIRKEKEYYICILKTIQEVLLNHKVKASNLNINL